MRAKPNRVTSQRRMTEAADRLSHSASVEPLAQSLVIACIPCRDGFSLACANEVSASVGGPKMPNLLQQAVIRNENVFAVLMDAVRAWLLGPITDALFEVGG